MQQKALLFGDSRTAELIMDTNCPKQQKKLGRTVSNLNQTIWDRYSIAILRQGNYCKIDQNTLILNKLHATINTTMVEVSPHDYTWGIGFRESDSRSQQRDTWLGQNKLGQILTELRDDVFLEFKQLTTIVFDLTSSKESKQERNTEQKDVIHQIDQKGAAKPNVTDKERFTFFNGVKSIYNVNYITNFIISNVTYNSVQQFMRHRKAKLFDDDVRASQIMNATNPDEKKNWLKCYVFQPKHLE